ncbi:LEAF RUST 10 DISEASE-RESISTANCE LOCUS RECEPTOR-LIKE PROTEIN KINASE 2.2 [Trifolium repens]|nr:LEAF RUST 10 DISEASE-RESISTANCE LOCUS RECEPTOR-LIKE PROTEIN KINASE 2.2 [Trifolium repens]
MASCASTVLILAVVSLILIFLYNNVNNDGDDDEQQSCSTKCGIHNISYPFRLEDSPKKCGDERYGTNCMNNTLYLQYEDSFFVDSYNKSMSELGLGDRCHIEFMYLTSWPLEVDHGGGGGNNNMSCTDIRNMMFYGFELSWINSLCKYGWYAKLHDNNQSKCEPSGNYVPFSFVNTSTGLGKALHSL